MAIPFRPPEGIIEQYLARPTGYQIGGQQIQNGLDAMVQYQRQKQQQKLEGINSLAGLYGNGGEWLANKFGKDIAGATGLDLSNYQSPQSTTPPVGSTVPSNTSSSPDISPQSLSTTQPNPQDPSGLIAHSVQNMGHPDVTGMYSKPSSQPNQSVQPAQPGMNGLAGINEFVSSHPGVGGKMLTNQLSLAKGYGDIERQPWELEKLKNDVAIQPLNNRKLENDVARQPYELEKIKQDIRFAQTKPIAEEVSKQGDSTTRTAQLRGLFDQLKGAVNESAGGLKAGLGATAYKVTRGAMGNAAGNQIENLGAPLTAALNYELTKRFNEAEAGYLQKSLMPSPYDQPALAQQKLTNLDNMITAIESGNEANVKNVAQALYTGQIPSNPTTPQPGPRPGIQTIPGNHNHQAVNADARQVQNSGGMVTIRDSQGGMHQIPSASISKAKQRDPGLQVVNQ
jgi:hypothetical protein